MFNAFTEKVLPLDDLPIPYLPSWEEAVAYWQEIETALRIRATEERLLQLFGEGKLYGTVHTCIGQEWSAVAVGRALQPQDYVFSNHRCHGHFLAYGGSVKGLIAEVMGKRDGVCGGRGGSQHLCYNRFFSNGIQGGIAPVTAGLAWAQQIEGNGGIAVVFLGDGTLGQGVLYETLNIASKWSLPILFVVENNRYAQSTASGETLSGQIAHRFEAFGIEGNEGNTWDWPGLLEGMAQSVETVREQGKPRFHIVDTYRLKPHSKGDDFRSPEEIKQYVSVDPLSVMQEAFAGNGDWQALTGRIKAEVDAAVAFAEASPIAVEGPVEVVEKAVRWIQSPTSSDKPRMNLAIQQALGRELEENARAVFFGEDIEGPYGGAFKVSGNLSLEHPGRVRNTPISEAAIVGIGNGLALAGYRPVVEIMFGDFLSLAADQWINHAAKFEWMYNGQVRCPLVVRTPMGGRRGYGPTHSQSLERHFVGLPGTRVICLHHRSDPREVYADIFATDQPTLVIENKKLYAAPTFPALPDGYQLLRSEGAFPVTRLHPGRPAEVTVVALGGTGADAEAAVLEAFDEHDIVAELFLPINIYPLDIAFLEGSLAQSRRLLVVEEGLAFASVSSEIIAQVASHWPEWSVRCHRVTSQESPIPTSRPLEEAILPNATEILTAMKRLAYEPTH